MKEINNYRGTQFYTVCLWELLWYFLLRFQTVIKFQLFDKLRFRFRTAKSYGSGCTRLPGGRRWESPGPGSDSGAPSLQPPSSPASLKIRGLQGDVVYLSWSIAPLVYEPKYGRGRGCGSQPMRTAVHITWHGAQMNFGDLTPYLTYGLKVMKIM